MNMLLKARPLLLLGIVLAMMLGISSAALADEPIVTDVEAPVGEEIIEDGEIIPRDDERPPAVEPDIAPGAEEPSVIAPASGIEEPAIVNPEGTIGIEEGLISPNPQTASEGGWSADEWVAMSGSAVIALLLGAGITFVATRRHYLHHPVGI
ncbi:MAG: hypothetical protein HKO82_00855 [Acidimicrobiia bacterium]|nr:hypothetical protein [Acidimicrobiia bacterium]